jgi:hypothetical protein
MINNFLNILSRRRSGHQSYRQICIGRHIATHPPMARLSRARVENVPAPSPTRSLLTVKQAARNVKPVRKNWQTVKTDSFNIPVNS